MKPIIVALTVSLAAACSASSSAQPNEPPAATRVVAQGTFKQYLLNPHGDVDGALLGDGTVVRFPPHAVTSASADLKVGDTIKVEGEKSGTTISHAKISKNDVAIIDPGSAPPKPKPPPPPADLAPVSWKGVIQTVTTNPSGDPDGFIFTDGSVAHAGPASDLASLKLAPGATITVSGRGGAYAKGKSMHVESITLADGSVHTLPQPPRPPR